MCVCVCDLSESGAHYAGSRYATVVFPPPDQYAGRPARGVPQGVALSYGPAATSSPFRCIYTWRALFAPPPHTTLHDAVLLFDHRTSSAQHAPHVYIYIVLSFTVVAVARKESVSQLHANHIIMQN